MRIDSHQHFWRYDPAEDLWISDDMPVLKIGKRFWQLLQCSFVAYAKSK